MNEAHGERLVVLPWRKSLEIAGRSLRVRLARSLITTATLVLAVSFLVFVRVNLEVANGLLAGSSAVLHETIAQAGYDLSAGATRLESSPKQQWLIFLSFLVCAVGIVNAQLMAVTERFREIGTMKCLGALDRFVLRLFMLEAAIQGLAGAAAGALLGTMLALGSGIWRFGRTALFVVSWGGIASAGLAAIGIGCILSLAGAMYPAIVAARMTPVAAMRRE